MGGYWNLKHSLYVTPPDDAEIRRRFQNERFHASEDPLSVRKMVFDLIRKHMRWLQVRAIVLEKVDIDAKHRTEEWLYENLYFYLYRSILERSGWISKTEVLQLMIDMTDDKRMRDATIRGIRNAEKIFGAPSSSPVYHISSFRHPFLQLADYFCWAIYRKYEIGDFRSYELIKDAIEDEWRLYKK